MPASEINPRISRQKSAKYLGISNYDEDEVVMSQNLDHIGQRDYAREVMRRRTLEIPPRPVESLEPFDRQVLATTYELRGRGCSENIASRLSKG